MYYYKDWFTRKAMSKNSIYRRFYLAEQITWQDMQIQTGLLIFEKGKIFTSYST